MANFRSAVRVTLRSLSRQWGFTLAAVATLTLGIGAATGVFSVVRGVLLRPLPYPEPERLVQLSEEHPGANSPLGWPMLSDLTLEVWEPVSQKLESVAVYSGRSYSFGDLEPTRIAGGSVSPSLFQVLRLVPVAGRFFRPEEAVEGAEPVAVLGHRLWRERFASDPSIVGRTVTLDGVAHRVVGVAPRGFSFPDTDSQLWTPSIPPRRDPDPARRGMRVSFAIARLADGATATQAAAEGTAAARGVTRPFVAQMLFGEGGPVEIRVRSVLDEMTRELRPALWALSAAAILLLLVACANGANLFLARGLARQRELAVRAALGASRGRIARHVLGESLALSLVAAALGSALAWALTRILPRWAPQEFPRLESISVDTTVLGFALIAALLSGLLAGVVPALRGGRVDLESALRAGAVGANGTTAGGGRLRFGLLAAEAALSVLLLVGSSLLLRSFSELLRVDAGFDAGNVLTAEIYLPGADDGKAQTDAFFAELLPRIGALPGVVAVGVGNTAPFSGSTSISGFTLPPRRDGEERRRVRANTWVVTPGYGEALGLRVHAGRFLEDADVTSATQAMVVNEEFVRLFLDGRSTGEVVGTRYPDLLPNGLPVVEIVGVVANVLKDGLDRQPQPEIYLASGSAGRTISREGYLLVRTVGDPVALAPELRRLVAETHPRAAIDRLGALDGRLAASVSNPRFAAWALSLFAGLALALTAGGLYGVLSYDVTTRRREIGVRGALGAARRSLVGDVVRRGLVASGLGAVAGMALAMVGAGLLRALLFGIAPHDPWSFALAPAVLLSIVLLASAVPALRAARIDPAQALRAE